MDQYHIDTILSVKYGHLFGNIVEQYTIINLLQIIIKTRKQLQDKMDQERPPMDKIIVDILLDIFVDRLSGCITRDGGRLRI